MQGGLTCEFLDQTKYIYLQELSEPRDNSLRNMIQGAVANNASSPVLLPLQRPELAALRSSAVPIESTPGCRSFELVWSRYAAYLVTPSASVRAAATTMRASPAGHSALLEVPFSRPSLTR